MQSLRTRRLAACLGLLAMLLLYAAPLWSQAQAAAQRVMAEMDCHGNGHAQPAPAHLDDACGYCSLLAGSPALGSSLPVQADGSLWLRPLTVFLAPPASLFKSARYALQPRAPPRHFHA
ncbi:DUF2946 family protein [Pseudomonas sp. LRF_L74]|uniref:DUF2946 family protein n=1 Tax=Pseudomonas sp. LRF_L74 TaxID=3369422 RepID=UPI003F60BABE